MKIAIISLAVLGALFSGFLGITWISDLSGITAEQRVYAQMMGGGPDFGAMQTAAYLLVLAFFAGLAGAYMVYKNEDYKLAAIVLIGGGILPVLFMGDTLLATFLMLMAGGIALYVHVRRTRIPVAPPPEG